MRALFHTPLTAPRQFVGTVDATHDSCQATARTLEQLQGHQRSAVAHIEAMPDAARRQRAADWALYLVAVLALVVIVWTS